MRPLWEHDDGIIAEWGDGLKGHVARALHGPFIVFFQQDCADEADDRGLSGEDPDDLGAARDLAVETFDRVRNWYDD